MARVARPGAQGPRGLRGRRRDAVGRGHQATQGGVRLTEAKGPAVCNKEQVTAMAGRPQVLETGRECGG